MYETHCSVNYTVHRQPGRIPRMMSLCVQPFAKREAAAPPRDREEETLTELHVTVCWIGPAARECGGARQTESVDVHVLQRFHCFCSLSSYPTPATRATHPVSFCNSDLTGTF